MKLDCRSLFIFAFLIQFVFVNSAHANKKLNQLEEKERIILSSLFEMNKKLKKLEKEKTQLSENKENLQNSIQNLNEKIELLETTISQQKKQVKHSLKNMLKFKNENYLRLLLSTQGSAELDRNLKILSNSAGKDVRQVKNYLESQKDLKLKKQKLSFRLEKMKTIANNISFNEQRLEEENLKKTKILNVIKNSKILQASSLKLKQLDTNSLLMIKGQLENPVQAKVFRPFGFYNDTDFKITLMNKGVLFDQSSVESKVYSVFQGLVSFVGELPGFGQTIIIDHGDHYYSVYGNTKNLQIKEGDNIKTQQWIAVAEHSQSEPGAGLYFEIRHFSEPMNPQFWLKGQL